MFTTQFETTRFIRLTNYEGQAIWIRDSLISSVTENNKGGSEIVFLQGSTSRYQEVQESAEDVMATLAGETRA